jgi:hypothetical protein
MNEADQAPSSSPHQISSRPWNWVALCFLAFVLAEIATIPVIYVAEAVLGLPHALGLALWAGSRVLVAGLVALALGRILIGTAVRPQPAAWLVLGIGAALAAMVQVALVAWSESRFALFDPDLVGLTAQLYTVVGGVGVAAFSTLSAPRDAALPPMIALLMATLLTLIIVVANVPGLADGIEPESIPLAVTLGATLLYALAVSALGGMSLAHRD